MTQFIKGQRIVVREDITESYYFKTSPAHYQYMMEKCAGRICTALGMENLSRLVRITSNGYASGIIGSVCVPVAYVKGV